MTRITHLKTLPKNVDYWDYYVLCRLDSNAGLILQRMEYWDGTKAGGNVHSEQINDNQAEAGTQPTQDTSRYVYKSREELAWELLGVCSERTAYETLDNLANTLHYLKTRHNPYKAFDRTLQYEFQEQLVQEHLEKLYVIVKHFLALGRQQRPVLYAIEELTRAGYYIYRVKKEDGTLDGKGLLTIELVAKHLRKMHHQMHLDNQVNKKQSKEKKKVKPVLPNFIRLDLKKDEMQGFSEAQDLPFPLCSIAQSNTSNLHNASPQNCTMDCAEEHNASCNSAQAIPVITTVITNNDYKTMEDTDTRVTASADERETPSPSFSENASHEDEQPSHPENNAELTEQIPQLNRLTSTPEPPTENISSTDESSREIERETANDTASSPVVNAAPDEMIHPDTRNTTNSYSPQSTSPATTETEPVTEQAEPPATGKGSGKRSGGKGGNKKATKPDLSPIAPPARPAPDLPFNAEKILAWGDYARGMKLPESPRRDSRAYKAREAARIIDGKAITEDLFLTLYFNWMKGIKVDLTDLPEGAIKSDTWPDYPVDLWVFAEHFEEERKRYNNRKKEVEKTTLKEKRDDVQRKAALEAASRAKKNDEFYQELLRTRREA